MFPNVIIRVKIVDGLQIPAYQTAGSAGCDVCSTEEGWVHPRERKLFSTGLSLEIPEGYECQVRGRSSLARDYGVIILNSPATIDSDFRGELVMLLYNTGDSAFKVNKGDRIAQLVFAPVARAAFETVTSLSETIRGSGGWGSTGRK